jgi:hypothetical protein
VDVPKWKAVVLLFARGTLSLLFAVLAVLRGQGKLVTTLMRVFLFYHTGLVVVLVAFSVSTMHTDAIHVGYMLLSMWLVAAKAVPRCCNRTKHLDATTALASDHARSCVPTIIARSRNPLFASTWKLYYVLVSAVMVVKYVFQAAWFSSAQSDTPYSSDADTEWIGLWTVKPSTTAGAWEYFGPSVVILCMCAVLRASQELQPWLTSWITHEVVWLEVGGCRMKLELPVPTHHFHHVLFVLSLIMCADCRFGPGCKAVRFARC